MLSAQVLFHLAKHLDSGQRKVELVIDLALLRCENVRNAIELMRAHAAASFFLPSIFAMSSSLASLSETLGSTRGLTENS